MIYQFKDKEGNEIEREFSMNGVIPKEIFLDGCLYSRVWNIPQFNMPVHSNNYIKKDMDDFSRCKISTDCVEVDGGSMGKIAAQLRVDKDGKPEMVYKSNPTQVMKEKPSKEVLKTLGNKMENYL